MSAPAFDVVAEFTQARGVASDADWGARARLRLAFANLEGHEADRALAEACEQVRHSGESPTDLFGDADDWAAERVVELSERGATFVEDTADLNTITVVALGLGGVVSALFAVTFWLGRDDGAPFNAWLACTPVLLGFAPVLLSVVWEATLRRHRQLVAGGAAALVGALFVGLSLWCFLLGQAAPRRSPGWWAAEALALLLLAGAAGRWIPEAPVRTVRTSGGAVVDDQRWVDLARGEMRERLDLTDAQVDEHIAQAVVHARQSGRSLGEEFGNPVGYARTMPGDQVVGARRKALGSCLLLACWLVVVFSDLSWLGAVWPTAWRVTLLALTGWQAARAVLAWHRIRSRAR